MENNRNDGIEEKLDKVIALLQQTIALQLESRGATHEDIGKSLQVAKSKIGKMLAGTKTE